LKAGLNTDVLKFAGGALIVIAAACIILPDLLKYLAGISRLLILIGAVVIVAWIMAVATTYLKPSIRKDSSSPAEQRGRTNEQAGDIQAVDSKTL